MIHSAYAAVYVAASNPISNALGHVSGWLETIVLIYVVAVGLKHLNKGDKTMVLICAAIGILLLSLLVVPLFWKGLAYNWKTEIEIDGR